MNKEMLLNKIKEIDEEIINILRERSMYERDIVKKELTNFGLRSVLDELRIELGIERENLEEVKEKWRELKSGLN